MSSVSGELSSRDILIAVISLVLGWLITHLYHWKSAKDQRIENRELKGKIDDLSKKLYGQRVEKVRELMAEYRPIPSTLADDFADDKGKTIKLYNEDVSYAVDAISHELRSELGGTLDDMASVSMYVRGVKTTVSEYLLSLAAYLEPHPVGLWYDALCTALVQTKKFPSIGHPPGSDGGTGIRIRQNDEDLDLIINGDVKDYCDNLHGHLREIFSDWKKRIDIDRKDWE